MKKIVIFVLSAVLMLLSGSCERMVPEGLSHADEQVLRDFRIRYPKAGIVEISNWDEGSTEIHFTDADGLDGVAIYLGETWMITEKTLYEDDFLFAIPRRVARTYVGTGIENEDYSSDYSYIVEVSRNGLDKKQFQITLFTVNRNDCTADFLTVKHDSVSRSAVNGFIDCFP